MTTRFALALVLAAAAVTTGCSSDSGSTTETTQGTDVTTFCGLVDEARAIEARMDTAALDDAMAGGTSLDDPEVLAAFQDWGATAAAAIDDEYDVMTRMRATTTNAEFQRAIDISKELYTGAMGDFADALVVASDSSDVEAALNDFYEAAAALEYSQEDLEAVYALDDFAVAQCGVHLSATND